MAFGKASPQWTSSRQWWTSLLEPEETLVVYSHFQRMELPAGKSVSGFADEVLVVCAAKYVESFITLVMRTKGLDEHRAQ